MQIDDGLPPLNQHSQDVIDAALSVHRCLGPGYVESAYEEALVVEFEARAIPFARQVPLKVVYRDRQVCTHRLDLLVHDEIVVEIKTVESVLQVHRAQVLSYLKASGYPVGLLINFNVARLRDGVSRLIWRSPDEYSEWRAWNLGRPRR